MFRVGCAGVIVLFSLVVSTALAEECTGDWNLSQTSTDAATPKGLSGDGSAAYPEYPFFGRRHLRFVLKGSFPRGRFVSLESVYGRNDKSFDRIFDQEIVPDEGSSNPFLPGADLDASPRNYTIHVTPEGFPRIGANQINLPNNKLLSLNLRIYAPSAGRRISSADIPRIFAFDARTGRSAACPRPRRVSAYFRFPYILDRVFPDDATLPFRDVEVRWGPNSAIPGYLYAVGKMQRGSEAAVVRFKAPTYADTTSGMGSFPHDFETRYWSICSQNFAKNETLGCLPDFLSNPDADGFVTVVVGKGEKVRLAAAAAGHGFIEDKRSVRQSTVQFAFRNLFPAAEFRKNNMYQGEYRPRGVICSARDYIGGTCGAQL